MSIRRAGNGGKGGKISGKFGGQGGSLRRVACKCKEVGKRRHFATLKAAPH